MELDGRSIRNLTQPHVKILSLPCLEEKYIVAVVEFCQLIELVQLRLGIEFGVFSAMGEHRCNIVQEMTVPAQIPKSEACAEWFIAEISPVGNASRRENQDSLLVLLDTIGRRLGLGAARLGDGLVNCCHDSGIFLRLAVDFFPGEFGVKKTAATELVCDDRGRFPNFLVGVDFLRCDKLPELLIGGWRQDTSTCMLIRQDVPGSGCLDSDDLHKQIGTET